MDKVIADKRKLPDMQKLGTFFYEYHEHAP